MFVDWFWLSSTCLFYWSFLFCYKIRVRLGHNLYGNCLGMLQSEYFGILKESAITQSDRITVGVHLSLFLVGISLPPHQLSSADISFFATGSKSKFQLPRPSFQLAQFQCNSLNPPYIDGHFGVYGAGRMSSNQVDLFHKSPFAQQSETVLHTHLAFPFFHIFFPFTHQKVQTVLWELILITELLSHL